jgi:hypothetical protein
VCLHDCMEDCLYCNVQQVVAAAGTARRRSAGGGAFASRDIQLCQQPQARTCSPQNSEFLQLHTASPAPDSPCYETDVLSRSRELIKLEIKLQELHAHGDFQKLGIFQKPLGSTITF